MDLLWNTGTPTGVTTNDRAVGSGPTPVLHNNTFLHPTGPTGNPCRARVRLPKAASASTLGKAIVAKTSGEGMIGSISQSCWLNWTRRCSQQVPEIISSKSQGEKTKITTHHRKYSLCQYFDSDSGIVTPTNAKINNNQKKPYPNHTPTFCTGLLQKRITLPSALFGNGPKKVPVQRLQQK